MRDDGEEAEVGRRQCEGSPTDTKRQTFNYISINQFSLRTFESISARVAILIASSRSPDAASVAAMRSHFLSSLRSFAFLLSSCDLFFGGELLRALEQPQLPMSQRAK